MWGFGAEVRGWGHLRAGIVPRVGEFKNEIWSGKMSLENSTDLYGDPVRCYWCGNEVCLGECIENQGWQENDSEWWALINESGELEDSLVGEKE